MKNKIIFCLIFALCLSMFSGFAAFAIEEETPISDDTVETTTEQTGTTPKKDFVPVEVDLNKIPDSYTKVKENKNLELHINYVTGEFAIRQKATGVLWFSTPLDWQNDQVVNDETSETIRSLLLVSYLNANFASVDVTSCNATVMTETYGDSQIISFMFNEEDQFFTIPLMLTLKDDYLDVEVLIDRIDELSDARVLKIGVLPMFGAANQQDSGYALLPDGTGSLMHFNQGYENVSAYESAVYEDDPTNSASINSFVYGVDLTESIRMPIYGIHKNGNGVLMVMDQGESQVKLHAEISGMSSSYNYLYPKVTIRESQTRRTSTGGSGAGVYYTDETPENFKMRIYPLENGQSDYVGMAQKYRSYLMNDLGMKPLAEDAGVPMNVSFIGAYRRIKHFLGFPYTGIDSMTTFDEAGEILTDLSQNGVDNIIASMMGWNSGGLESKVALNFNPESMLGGASAAKKLLQTAESLDIPFMLDQDVQNFYGRTGKYSKYNATTYGLDLSPVPIFPFGLSMNRVDRTKDFHNLFHPEVMLEIATNFASSVGSKQGIKHFSFNTAGEQPYAAYNNERISTRDESTNTMTSLFEQVAASTDGIVSTRKGNAFVFPAVNNVVDAPVYASHMYTAQTEVPVYQMALRGLVRLSGPAVNLSPEDDDIILRCAQTGMGLYYILSKESSSNLKDTGFNNYYSCDIDSHKESLLNSYKKLKPVYDAVGVSALTGYEMLDSKVNISSFENGAKVYVNYSEADVTVNGVTIPARDFVVVGGAK